LRADFFNTFNCGRFILAAMDFNNLFTFGVSDRAGDFNQPRHIQTRRSVHFLSRTALNGEQRGKDWISPAPTMRV